MVSKKSFFRDHFVLFLFSINSFGAIFTFLFIVLRLSFNHNSSYIVQYRPILGLNKYKIGSIADIIALAVFAILVTAIILGFSYYTFKINRYLSIAILSLGLLLLCLDIIISNSIIFLH